MSSLRQLWPTCLAVLVTFGLASSIARATPSLVVDVDSGDVLFQDMATAPWYPASLTKLMTTYVALSAVQEGRITLDTPLLVSPRAASMPPSKMGFKPGTLVTLDNALKMLMVKSPNDVAVTIAEGVSGSVESFADEMNVYAVRLGLHESHFVNPNGLPDDRHMSSARDMATIGRALLHDFPQERSLFSIGMLSFGRQMIRNHNGLLGRYPGADGMKTGFTCAAGFNVVASAEQGGRHLITVVMGSPSVAERNQKAAALFDRYFAEAGTSLGRLETLPGSGTNEPPNMREYVCGRNRHTALVEAESEDAAIPLTRPGQPGAGMPLSPSGKNAQDQPQSAALPAAPLTTRLSAVKTAFVPVPVFIGPVPGWSGRIAQAVGTGSKELGTAPVRAASNQVGRPVEQGRAGQATAAPNPAIELPSATPLALVGATALAPATMATKRLVRASPSFSLSVGRHGRAKAAAPAKPAPAQTVATAESGNPAARKDDGSHPGRRREEGAQARREIGRQGRRGTQEESWCPACGCGQALSRTRNVERA